MYMPVNALKMEASIVPYVLIAKFFKVKKILERTYSKCEERFISCPDEKKPNHPTHNNGQFVKSKLIILI